MSNPLPPAGETKTTEALEPPRVSGAFPNVSVSIDLRGVPEILAKVRLEVAGIIRAHAARQANMEVVAALLAVAAEVAQDTAEQEAAEAVKEAR